MAFIFDAERDPRGEIVSGINVGDKVKVRGMAMPGEILSGPHKSPSGNRWLVTKADGNVTLLREAEFTRIVPREDQVSDVMARMVYGLSYASLNMRQKVGIAVTARRVLAIADETRA